LRYGGNTACVVISVGADPPLILDLGTGLRSFGQGQLLDGSFRGTALLSHVHWDHIQGLPFFAPADRTGAELDIFGPAHEEGSLASVIDGFIRPPYFPVTYSQLRGTIKVLDMGTEPIVIGASTITARPVPHTAPTLGYRVESGTSAVAYVSDHQAPPDLSAIADSVLELADGVDLLIHDAQYTDKEFPEKAHWGHCTVEYAVEVARLAGAKTLAMFHHDPGHDDDDLDAMAAQAGQYSRRVGGPPVFAAYEGQIVDI
jgi:phosphoribosyl 1,2-cyclic phosphodiesterase